MRFSCHGGAVQFSTEGVAWVRSQEIPEAWRGFGSEKGREGKPVGQLPHGLAGRKSLHQRRPGDPEPERGGADPGQMTIEKIPHSLTPAEVAHDRGYRPPIGLAQAGQLLSVGLDDRAGRRLAAFERVMNSLAQQRLAKSGGVADQGCSFAVGSVATSAKPKREADDIGDAVGSETLERVVAKLLLAEQDTAIAAVDPDIDMAALRKKPAIAVAHHAEQKFRHRLGADVGIRDKALDGEPALEVLASVQETPRPAVGAVGADQEAGVESLA